MSQPPSNNSVPCPESATPLEEPVAQRVMSSIDGLLSQLNQDWDATDPAANCRAELLGALRQAQAVIAAQEQSMLDLTTRSERMAQAQADAIVYSAEVIEELEHTKLQLSAAKHAAESVASDNQQLANTIFECSNDAVLILCGNQCIACNQHALSLLQEERTELIGHCPRAFDLTFLDSTTTLSAWIIQAGASLRDQQVQMLDVELKFETVPAHWVEVTLSRFSLKGAEHLLLILRDISARKQYETELRRNRDFLNNIINAVPDPLSVVNTGRQLVVANDAFCQQVGKDRNNLVGQPIDHFSACAGIPTFEECVSAAAIPETRAILHRFVSNTGDERITSVKQTSFIDSVGGEEYIVLSARDITADQKRQEKLKVLASFFRNASEGVAILADDGQLLEANPAMVAMTRLWSADELTGHAFFNVLTTAISNFESAIQQVLGGESWADKVTIRDTAHFARTYWISLSRSNDELSNATKIIALVADVTELEARQAELKQRALHDELTGLANRVYFRDYLIEQTSRPNYSAAVCFLDLDNFKHVNDSLGHAAGDELLTIVTERIQNILPQQAFLARFGGDEFAMIIDRTGWSDDGLSRLLDELLADVRRPIRLRNGEVVVSLSLGVCQYPEHAHDVANLMQSADIAMYAAKSEGKNRVRIFSTEMQATVDRRYRVQMQVREALANGYFQLYYQPKIDATTKQLRGCESLIRLRLPDGTFLSPGEFIPVAEQTGLIVAIGEYVFRQAAIQAAEWAALGHVPSVAVNISPYQMHCVGFIESLQGVLHDTGAQAEWFELEITENAMMEDVHHAVAVSKQLSQMGFRIAIDDFGTGYSSLSYLKHFKIDTLKIDISFVRDVVHDPYSQAIISSIVSLGHGLGLTVVAEGVEEEKQAEILADLGCHLLQGYLYGRPAPPSEFSKRLVPADR